MKKGTVVHSALGLAAALLVLAMSVPAASAQETDIEKLKREMKTFKVIGDADLYCSIFVLGFERSEVKILAAERGAEKVLLSDGDICFINRGSADGIQADQVFLIVEPGSDIIDPVSKANLGALGYKRGRARVLAVDENRATVRLEKTCGQVQVGHELIPLTAREELKGLDQGLEPVPAEGEGVSGRIIYLENTLEQIGSTYWALINLGTENGLEFGQQLIGFRRVQGDVPRQAIASLIVIDAGPNWAAVKVLTSKDVLRVGTEVQTK